MSSIAQRLGLGAAAALLAGGMLHGFSAWAAESVVRAPAPLVTKPATATRETAVFAGGCFWGVQGVFQHVNGVVGAVSGYTGGSAADARYDRVGTGETGHAEAVRVVFNPRVVSYGQLLQIYFSVVADPTMLDAQGPDRGPQYRTALFPTSEAQRQIAAAYIDQLGKAKLWPRPIVTRLERAQGFYPAEAYHQDYLTRHPEQPYIRYNDLPKVAGLKQLYPALYRATPVLVRG